MNTRLTNIPARQSSEAVRILGGSVEWKKYEAWIAPKWRKELDTATRDRTRGESKLHNFLKRHPALLPYLERSTGHHGCFPAAAITEPRLPGLETRIPDFMWLMSNSAEFVPTLIELESPAKRWWRTDGQPTAKLTQAIGQLREWKAWFQDGRRIDEFFSVFDIPDYYRQLAFTPCYILVFGRREEANRTPYLTRQRRDLANSDQIIMTWDRLQLSAELRNFGTVKRSKYAYEMICPSPCFELRDHDVEKLERVTGVEAAIGRSRYLSTLEKRAILGDLPGWADRARAYHSKAGIKKATDQAGKPLRTR